MSSEEQQQQESALFHLDLHAWLDAQQTSHGVRHDDYAQYHAYCTRRLSRLAHKPKDARAHLVHSGKYATPNPDKPKTAGGRHAFCGRTHDTLALTKTVTEPDGEEAAASETETEAATVVVPVPVPHINILWHLLVASERSWAHANEIRKKGGRKKRQNVLKKLKRANQWATILVEKAKISADAETRKECEAYAAWMLANYAMEQMRYQVSDRNNIESNPIESYATNRTAIASMHENCVALKRVPRCNTCSRPLTILLFNYFPTLLSSDRQRKLRPCHDLVP